VSIEQQLFKNAIALTGGIATGKSTAAMHFADEGFTIIDADRIAHQMLDVSATDIVRLFGNKILQNGRVDRKVLGSLVFTDPAKRKALESFLHPLIYREITQLSQKEEMKNRPYLIDIPLFFETARYNIDKVVVVYARQEQQIERAMKRDSSSRDEVLRRIEAQMNIEEKRKRASYLIDNTADEAQLYAQSLSVINAIKKDFL